MAKIISIGYYVKFIVPNNMVAAFAEMLGDVQMLEGSGSSEKIIGVEFEVKNPPDGLGIPMSTRELQLEADAKSNSDRWYKEYTEKEKLKKELADEKEKVETLIRSGIKEVFCPTEVLESEQPDENEELY